MTKNNVVDDYYSSIDSSKDDKQKKVVKKKKIIVWKIKKKKPEEETPKREKIIQVEKTPTEKKPKVTKVTKVKSEDKRPARKPAQKRTWENFKNNRSNNTKNNTNNNNNKKDFSKPRSNNQITDKKNNNSTKKNYNLDNKPKSSSYSEQKEFNKSNFKGTNQKNNFKKSKKTDISEEKTSKKFKKDKSSKNFKNKLFQEEKSFLRSNKLKNKKKEEKKIEDIKQDLTSKTWETVVLWDILSVKEFSEKIWVTIVKLIPEFMKNGIMVTLNSKVDFETLSIIADTFWVNVQRDLSEGYSVEDLLDWNIAELLKEDDSSVLQERAPVISIMWHVDHGKTSLLDCIRKTKVADKEAWGITQSIWAYQVRYEDKNITFLDTPGHEAFTVMRARWAKSTDIAILVVAADEWVKPQTIESINHAREAWIPVIVAINKMDKEWANPDNVKWQLSQNWLLAEDWGGDVPMIPVSAKAWTWIDDLLEIIVLQSELLELKANPNRAAVWTVIESHLDPRVWPVATVLINTWTLKKWDCLVCKWAYWRLKVLKDFNLKNTQEWWPSAPVLVIGLDSVVQWWDIVQVVNDIEIARKKAVEYKELMASKKSAQMSWIDMIMSRIKSWNLKQLKVILKADTNWSLEALKWSLIKLSTPETQVQIIHAWVGSVTQWDVLMTQWSNAILVWFNVDLIWNTKQMVEETKVEFISSKIIYHITERIEKIITWMLDPKEVEVALWEAKVWGVFYEWKWFTIIGLQIEEWSKIENKALLRVIRNNKVIWKWEVDNLKSGLLDVQELTWPIECWIKFVWDVKIELKDTLEVYKIIIEK